MTISVPGIDHLVLCSLGTIILVAARGRTYFVWLTAGAIILRLGYNYTADYSSMTVRPTIAAIRLRGLWSRPSPDAPTSIYLNCLLAKRNCLSTIIA